MNPNVVGGDQGSNNAESDMRKLHSAVSENIMKWQRLMHNLETEVSLHCSSFSSLFAPPAGSSDTGSAPSSSIAAPSSTTSSLYTPASYSPTHQPPTLTSSLRYTSFFLGAGEIKAADNSAIDPLQALARGVDTRVQRSMNPYATLPSLLPIPPLFPGGDVDSYIQYWNANYT